jgi:hypothetical protein
MNIQTFRNDFSSSRSNRYKITGTMPNNLGTLDNSFTLYAKSVSFPGSQIGMIPVSYQGRVIKFAGERQFAEWSVQVYDVSNNNATSTGTGISSVDIRTKLEQWIEDCDGANTHKQRFNNAATAVWTVQFDDIDGDTIGGNTVNYNKKMELYNCWPIDISAIDLNYEAADSFAEFTLTFAYDYHQEV